MHLGTAFQLIDDVLDYSGDAAAIGKNLGDDLAEGKPTLPLIRAMASGSAAQAGAGAARDRRRAGAPSSRACWKSMRATGALDYAREVAVREARGGARRAAQPARLGIQGIFARIGVLLGGRARS